MPGKIPRRPSGSSAEAEFQKFAYDGIVNESKAGFVDGVAMARTTLGNYVLPGGGGRGGTGAAIRTFKIQFAEADYLVCQGWDGSTLDGTIVYIAKPEELKCTKPSEMIYGENATYAYASDDDEPFMEYGTTVPASDPPVNEWGESESDYDTGEILYQLKLNVVRTVVRDGVTEAQRVIKVWTKGDIIQAIEFDGGDTAVGYITTAGQPIEFLMLSAARNWARI